MVQSKKPGKYMAVFNAVLCVFCICMCGSRNFHQVGGGGGGGVEDPGPPDSKKLGQRCFVIFAVFSPHLQLIEQFYRGDRSQGPMVYFLENNNFQRFQRGSNILRGGRGEGCNFFPGGGGGGGGASKC